MYQFTDDCKIGIEEIDLEHQELFALINDAMTANDAHASSERIADILEVLQGYAATHFAHEEEYMRKIHDPELTRQQKEHAAFSEKLSALIAQRNANADDRDLLSNLLEYLSHWLFHHILGSDILIGKISSAKDPAIVPGKQIKTGIPQFDAEHARLFDLVQEAADTMRTESLHNKYETVLDLLQSFQKYAAYHIRNEESYMRRDGNTALDAHLAAHQAFLKTLESIGPDTVSAHHPETVRELIAYLRGFLTEHAVRFDQSVLTEHSDTD